MHPILGSRRRLTIFLACWIPTGALLGCGPYVLGGGDLRQAWWWWCLLWGETFALPLLGAAYVCRFSPITSASAPRVFLTVATAAVVSVWLWMQVGELWFWLLQPVASEPARVFSNGWMVIFAGAGAALLFLFMCTVYYVLAAADDRQAATARLTQASIAARDAELRALRAQVDPHFLFNCLHSISALIGTDPTQAREMCIELAEFFRESLRAGRQPRITLAAEAELVERYFDIERLRFGDRLRATIAIAPDAEGALVPPLLLQPLAENAIRHGVATLVDGGDVTIAVTRTGDRIDVAVENAFDADGRRNGTGVGLANVRARLESSYAGRASLQVHVSESRFRADISLPLEEATGATP
jgi:two-component system sensor histidine kinase AlgZ